MKKLFSCKVTSFFHFCNIYPFLMKPLWTVCQHVRIRPTAFKVVSNNVGTRIWGHIPVYRQACFPYFLQCYGRCCHSVIFYDVGDKFDFPRDIFSFFHEKIRCLPTFIHIKWRGIALASIEITFLAGNPLKGRLRTYYFRQGSAPQPTFFSSVA